MSEVSQLAGETVDHEQRGSGTLVDIVNALAVDVEKTAKGRHDRLDAPRRIGGESRKAGTNDQQQQQREAQARHALTYQLRHYASALASRQPGSLERNMNPGHCVAARGD
jgi:hypothetical protein